MKLKQYSILKIDMSHFKNNNGVYAIDTSNKYYRKMKTLGKESEMFRIVNHLNQYYKDNKIYIQDNIDDNEEYPLIQDLLCVHINKGTKKYYEDSDGILTVKYINPESIEKETVITYIRLLASSSHVRNKKVIYVNEKIYDDALDILLCGMPKDTGFEVIAKFNSHFGLCTTDGIPVEMPNILVIPDYEHGIEEYFDVVEEHEQHKYKVKPNEKRIVKIKPHDGAGLVDVGRVYKWCNNKDELGLDYIPSSLLVRALPGIKGNLYTVDLREYIEEKGVRKRVDVWGDEIELMDEQGNLLIDCVLTASMVKFYRKYSSFEKWFNAFNTIVKGYSRTFNICQWSENPKELENKVPLSYQVLQSLQLSKNQIKILCKDTIETIKNISSNVDEFMKFRGIDTDNKEKLKVLPEYYRILKTNKYLFHDPWLQKKIQKDIDGIKKRAYLGGIFVQGNYQVLGVDVVSLLEWALGLPVKGVLEANEVYSDYWNEKQIFEVALARFPHVSHEWKISKVVNPECEDAKYLKYQCSTMCISMHDSTDMRLGGADHDNDHVISLSNRVLIQAAKHSEDNKNTVLYIESWKDKEDQKPKPIKEFKINNMRKLIKTDCDGMSGNIGVYVNEITKLWSKKQTEEIKNYIKIMSVICSKVIDFAKTGIKAKIPEEIKEILEQNKRLPYFMKYRYPDKLKKQNQINANLSYIGSTEKEEFFTDTDCTMNLICKYLENNISDIKIETPEGEFDYSKFYKKKPDKNHSVYYKPVLEKLIKLKEEHDHDYSIGDDLNKDEKIENANQYKLFYDYCKNCLLAICPYPDKLIDILVYAFYEDKEFYKHNPDKAILFNCYGTRIRQRLDGKARDIPIENLEEYIIQKTKAKKNGKRKLVKSNNKDRKVYFTIYKNKENIEIVHDADRGLNDEEIDYIKNNASPFEARRLLLVLLILDKSCTKYEDVDFKIYYGSKDKTKITKKSIQDLSRINSKQYDKYIEQFRENETIKLTTNSNKSYLICKVDCNNEGENKILINDLNKIKENFKYVK